MDKKVFEEWAILELMGHRRLAGLIREETIGSASFIRIDVPGGGVDVNGKMGFSATQFYNPAAIYCITPVTEEMATKVAARDRPEPVSKWEFPTEPQPRIEGGEF